MFEDNNNQQQQQQRSTSFESLDTLIFRWRNGTQHSTTTATEEHFV